MLQGNLMSGGSKSFGTWGVCTGTLGGYLLVGEGDGLKTMLYEFRDALANTTIDVPQTITLDTTAPSLVYTGSNPINGFI